MSIKGRRRAGYVASLARQGKIMPDRETLDAMLGRMTRPEVARACGVAPTTVDSWVSRFGLRHHQAPNHGSAGARIFASESDSVCLAHARQPCGSVTPGQLSYWQQNYMMGAEQ